MRTRKVTRAFRIDVGYWARGRGTRAALSPDGKRIALADGESVAVVGLSAGKVVTRRAATAAGARLLAGREALDVQVAAAGVAA